MAPHVDILSHTCTNCKVSVPHTLFTSFNSYYLSEQRGFEVATNPTACCQGTEGQGFSTSCEFLAERLKFTQFLWAWSCLTSKDKKKPYWLVWDCKEIENWARRRICLWRERRATQWQKTSPKIARSALEGHQEQNSPSLTRCVRRSYPPVAPRLLTMTWFNSRGIRYRPCKSKKMACIQICKLNYSVLHTEFQSLRER